MNKPFPAFACAMLFAGSRAALADMPMDDPLGSPETAEVPVSPQPPSQEDPCNRPIAYRVAPVAMFLRMANVSTYGGGGSVAVGGGRCGVWDVLGDVQFVEAVTPGGLEVHAISFTADVDAVIVKGFRLGGGGGFSDVGIRRATTGEWVEGIGVRGFVRAGYDSGESLRPFVFLDFNGYYHKPAWGPSLQVGIRF